MKRKYQITLISTTGQYKPISCIIEIADNGTDLSLDSISKKKIQTMGVQKICARRYWKTTDLRKFGYTKAKVRLYDLDTIKEEKINTYAIVKAEKYLSGEWKKSK